MKHLTVVIALFCTAFAWSASGSKEPLPDLVLDRADYNSLQRGSAIFFNYCLGCHSAQYVRFDHLEKDLGMSQELMAQFLHHNTAKLTDSLTTAMSAEEAKAWFNQATIPDLSLSARVRGKDWLYAYLRGFYRDDKTATGWNNKYFSNVAMPNVFANEQGIYRMTAEGELQLEQAGSKTPEEFNQMVYDLVNFMDYMGDPYLLDRHRAGYLILTFLFILLVLSYFLYREYWRDIH